MSFQISSVLQAEMPRIKVVAVGAMDLGGPEAYTNLVQRDLAEVIGFEPNSPECEKLNRMALQEAGDIRLVKRRYLPYAIGDGSRRTLYITFTGYTTSLYRPNFALLSKFQGLAELYQIKQEQELDTVRLDDVKDIDDADWLVTDVQGAEVDVFRGAPNLLDKVVMVQTEVEFVSHYENQPLFSDVDLALRKHDFVVHSLTHFACPPFSAMPAGMTSHRNQMSWSDFIYAKNFMNLQKLTPRKRLAMAVLLHEVYASYDMCAQVLQEHDALTGSNFYRPYLAKLATPA